MTKRKQLELPEPQPCGWTKIHVYGLAEKFALKLELKPGDDLVPVINEKLGGKVPDLTRDVWVSEPDTIIVRGPRDFEIRIGPFQTHERRRFSIAHELGHYVLHSQEGKIPIRATREGSGRVEWEANWFAGAFLMPKATFKDAWTRANGSVALVAAYFDVSYAACQVRAQTLSLL